MTKFLRGLLLVDGVNPRNLPEQLYTCPRGLPTLLLVLPSVSMAAMLSGERFSSLSARGGEGFAFARCLPQFNVRTQV